MESVNVAEENEKSEDIPLWMASASLSGISMLNSYRTISSKLKDSPQRELSTHLLHGHYNLNNIQAVQTEVIREVRGSGDLAHV
jgi:hypothetical protein